MTAAERWLGWLAALLGVVLLAWVQFSILYLDDGDSYFHVRAAAELVEHGVRRQFPATQFSTWKDSYSDKDFLFHLGLVPFLGLGRDLVASAKLAIVAWDAAVLGALLFALRRVGARFAGLWILGLLAYPAYLQYLLSCRPHLLSNALILVEVALLVRGQWKTLAAVAALHVWSHSSFVLVPAMAAAALAADRLGRQPVRWRLLLAAVLGVAAGSLVHPYFPNNLGIAWSQIVDVARHAWGADRAIPSDLFGLELLPLPPAAYLRSAPIWAPALAGLVAVRWRGGRALGADMVAPALIAVGLLALSALSSRFYPLFLSLCAVIAGQTWTRWAAERTPRELWRSGWLARAVMLGLGLCPLLAQVPKSVWALRQELRRGVNEIAAQDAVRFLDAHAATTDLVYHPTWREFAALWFFRPDGRYVDALDPVFLYRFDRARFASSLALFRGQADDVHRVLVQDFGARWVFLMKYPRNLPFARALRQHPRIRLRFEDDFNEVHEVLRAP